LSKKQLIAANLKLTADQQPKSGPYNNTAPHLKDWDQQTALIRNLPTVGHHDR